MAGYGSADGYRQYFADRGIAIDVALDDTEIIAANLVASEWLDAHYRLSFGGLKIGMRQQIREWPRTGAFDVYGYSIDSTVVPPEIEYATYEAASRVIVNPSALTKDWTPPKYVRAAVEGAVSVQYASFSSALDTQTQFGVIDNILSPILTGDGMESTLSGGACRT